MGWDVEYTPVFGRWWAALNEEEQISVDAVVRLLERFGPALPFPHSSRIATSRHPRMRELRIQHHGRPLRVLYAFDPRRTAILLFGGDKTGRDRWYEEAVPIADALLDEHLETLHRKGHEDG
ncbi:MAG TPA: type II toxin-antitoxin system RelE/ParE family toxin [Candidatus Polarisedimenticolaceae bacterium]